MEDVRIIQMAPRHVPRVASLHLQALPDDLLPNLGEFFLRDVYYHSMLNCPHAVVLVALLKDEVVGFVNIATAPEKLFRWLLINNFWKILYSSIFLFLKRPFRLWDMVQSVFAETPKLKDSGEISFIAVKPHAQKRGIGKKMIEEVNIFLAQKHLRAAFTKTKKANQYVVNFYIKNWEAIVLYETSIAQRDYVYISWLVS